MYLEEILKSIDENLKEINQKLSIKSKEITMEETQKEQSLIQSNTEQSALVIPVTPQVESFTQEQIAVGMANAMDAGRKDVVQNILTTFKARSLMEIAPENYNKIAIILREAGFKI